MEQDQPGPAREPEGVAAKEAKAADGWAEIEPAPGRREPVFAPAAETE